MQAPDKNKMSSVENALNQIHRQFGKGSIMRLGSQEAELVPVIPTGALSLDIALGVGGLPRGRKITTARRGNTKHRNRERL